MPRPGKPQVVGKPESEFELAERAFGSMKAPDLNLPSLFEELEAVNRQLQELTHGQSRLLCEIDSVQRGLGSVIEVVGCSPKCEPECNCAKCAAVFNLQAQPGEVDKGRQTSWPENEASAMHAFEQSAPAQAVPKAADCNGEDPDCMDITSGKADNRGHKNLVDMPHRWDNNVTASCNRHLSGEAGLHRAKVQSENVNMPREPDPMHEIVPCPLEPKMREDDTPRLQTSQSHVSCHARMVELELETILLTNIQIQKKTQQRTRKVTARLGTSLASINKLRKFMEKMHGREWEMLFDSVIGLFIILNAIFIGLSMDAKDPSANSLLVIDSIFGVIFWLELIVKLCLHGWREQYCGKDACLNIFDTSLVGADTIQFIIQLFFQEQSEELSNQGVSASLFRIVRLMRLARILRILQLSVFKDLLTMIQGMMGGLATLCWSVVLYVIFIYVVALLFRESLGPNSVRESNEKIEMYFETVPRSMFTMFRCSFGDCSTGDGMPLFEHVTEIHGAIWALAYSCFIFVVVIGLFNVISAIFIENTLASASEMAAKKRRALLEDPERWAKSVCELLQALLREDHPGLPDLLKLEESACTQDLLKDILQNEFPAEQVKNVVRHDELAQRALHRLDIDPNDHAFLNDILDPQNDGSITVLELVNGLKRLRGEPRRSDIITIDLMVRSLQERIDEIWKWMHQTMKERMDSPR